jgi:ribosomal 50S subunit-recycling heat shock protein
VNRLGSFNRVTIHDFLFFELVLSMRLDLFLKASRLCPRRSVAQKLCDAGLVSLNGLPAKSAHPVKAGDEITVRRNNKTTFLRVLAVPRTRQTSRTEAGGLYEILDEQLVEPIGQI